MHLSEQAQATLLLTAWFGKKDDGGATPLTPTEWGRFALYLMDIGRNPGDLLQVSNADALLSGFVDKKVTPARVRKLLDRSAALGIALEKWERAGLWVLTRSDSSYPRRWKQQLKNDAPPVLFGAGNRELLNCGGIAVVGSRDLNESQVAFTGKLGRDIAFQGRTVISGGARGADEAAMLGALGSEGMAMGVLADSLLRTCTTAKYRKALMSNDLVLVSPFNPEAGFNVGNAMARNKYIYCLSDAAIVIAATENKGGTWSGAIEDLKHGWVPLWVVKGNAAGNKALVDMGASWLPDEFDAGQLAGGGAKTDKQIAVAEEVNTYQVSLNKVEDVAAVEVPIGHIAVEGRIPEHEGAENNSSTEAQKAPGLEETPYQFFLHRLGVLLKNGPMSAKELQNATLLKQKQLTEWLKQANADGAVVKTKSPMKYQLPGDGDNTEQSKSSSKKKIDGDERSQKGFGF